MSSSGQGSKDSRTSPSTSDPHVQHAKAKGSSSPSSMRGKPGQLSKHSKSSSVRRPEQSLTRSAALVPKTFSSRDPKENVTSNKRYVIQLEEAIPRDSIADDPFFQSYKSPDSEWITQLLKPQTKADVMAFHKNSTEDKVVPAEETMGDEELGPNEEHAEEINIGVLGASGVGKSTFVEKALDLDTDSRAISKPLQKSVSFNGGIYNVRMLELTFDDLRNLYDQSIRWPPEESSEMPRIDGVVALYDVMNPSSLVAVPEVLNALQEASLPTILASSKCDNPPTSRKVDTLFVEQKVKALMKSINVTETSKQRPESQKRCVSLLLQDIVSSDAEQGNARAGRPRAKSTADTLQLPSLSTLEKHQRSASDSSIISVQKLAHFGDGPDLKVLSEEPETITPGSPITPKSNKSSERFIASDDYGKSFLDLDESPTRETPGSFGVAEPHAPLLLVPDTAAFHSASTFAELVTRLRNASASNEARKYSAIFLAFYRNFASPLTLLEAIIEPTGTESHGLDLEDQDFQALCLTIIQRWITSYPGDFAHSATRLRLLNFVLETRKKAPLVSSSEHVRMALDNVVENDDTEWATTDSACARPSTAKTFLSTSSADTVEEGLNIENLTESLGGYMFDQIDSLKKSTFRTKARVASCSTALNALGPSTGVTDPMTSSQTTVSGAGTAQKQARLLLPNPTMSLTKDKWRQFMAQSSSEIARELTRLDWVMFNSIRPRDIVRHVTIPMNERCKYPSLQNVNRMIEHFNHIALLATNLVLLRDKPKHRAQMLQKLMQVARRVREQNNYNTLGALVAGIQGSAVHRLAQTRALISPEIHKDFMKLEILMSTQKGHFAYRLAWHNTRTSRVPFLPLHRADLVAAEAGNKSLIGDKINWKKFEVMGEILLNMTRAQATSYIGIRNNEDIRALILDCKICKDEDELHQRSVAIEPLVAYEAGIVRRKLTWRAKNG